MYGPMAEVVYNSLQYLTDDDVRAMAVYLKGIAESSPPRLPSSKVPSSEASLLIIHFPQRFGLVGHKTRVSGQNN